MKYMVTFKGQPSTYLETLRRYKKAYDAKPAGFTILGFWHGPDGAFILVQAPDEKAYQALYAYMSDWSDVQSFNAIPVLDNEKANEALGYTS